MIVVLCVVVPVVTAIGIGFFLSLIALLPPVARFARRFPLARMGICAGLCGLAVLAYLVIIGILLVDFYLENHRYSFPVLIENRALRFEVWLRVMVPHAFEGRRISGKPEICEAVDRLVQLGRS